MRSVFLCRQEFDLCRQPIVEVMPISTAVCLPFEVSRTPDINFWDDVLDSLCKRQKVLDYLFSFFWIGFPISVSHALTMCGPVGTDTFPKHIVKLWSRYSRSFLQYSLCSLIKSLVPRLSQHGVDLVVGFSKFVQSLTDLPCKGEVHCR